MDANLKEATIDIFEFGKTDETQRQLIRNILDSYHHDWDVLAELCQNAVDAIRDKDPAQGSIYVRFDRQSRSVEVSDTGVGMTRERRRERYRPT